MISTFAPSAAIEFLFEKSEQKERFFVASLLRMTTRVFFSRSRQGDDSPQE